MLLPLFKANLRLQHVIGSFPLKKVEIDEFGEPKLVPSSKRSIRWQWYKISLALGFTLVLWVQMFLAIKEEELVTTLESTLCASAISVFIIVKATQLKRNDAIVALMNSLFVFEKRQWEEYGDVHKPLAKREECTVYFCQGAAIASAPVFISSGLLQRWLNPCTSALLAWKIMPECADKNSSQEWSSFSLGLLGGILLLSVWIITDLIGAAVFQVVQLSFSQVVCLINGVRNFHESLQIVLWNPRADAEKIMLQYRQLQILIRLLNWIQQDLIIVAVLNLFLILIIISTYALISMGWHISIPHFILFSSALLDSIVADVFCFGAFAQVHSESSSTLVYLKKKFLPKMELEKRSLLKRGELKLLKKFVLSMYPLKVRIGGVNFVEKFTPIAILDFCVAQIVSLLLID
ncbi:unnamed protein product [Orchesella dallaii]|uniref:Gustatory receptor n=1 Tax=Orchesella dallaii TaxID=48710 RepID=A0ABP1RCR0_9HEXA